MVETLQALYLVNKKAHQLKKLNKSISDEYFEIKKKAVLKLWLGGVLKVSAVHKPDLVWFESVIDNGKFNFHQKDEYEIIQLFGAPVDWNKKNDTSVPVKDKCTHFWSAESKDPDYKRAMDVIKNYISGFDFVNEKEKLRLTVREEVCESVQSQYKQEIISSKFSEKDLINAIESFPKAGNYEIFFNVFFAGKPIYTAYYILQELKIECPIVSDGKIIWPQPVEFDF